MNPPRWGGPGVGWVWDQADVIAAVFACLFASPEEIRAGRLPGNQENTMSTKFKFPLGALVVLSYSFDAAAAQKTDSDKEVREGAERAAAAARNNHLAENGRSDLIQSRRAMGAEPDWSGVKLIAMHSPIEAGVVIGRIEYLSDENRYLVRYRSGDAKQVEEFISESALRLDPRMNPSPFASERAAKDPAADTDPRED